MGIAAPLAYFIGNSITNWEIIDITLIHSSFIQFLLKYRASNKLTFVKYFNLTHQPIWGDYGYLTINEIDKLLLQPPFSFLTSLSVCSLVDEQMAYRLIDDEQPFSAPVLRFMIARQQLKHLTLRGVIGATNKVLDLHNAILDGHSNSLQSIDIKSQTHSLELFMSMFRLPGFGSPSITDLYLQVGLSSPKSKATADFDSITEMIMISNCNLQTLCIRSSCILADGMFGMFLPGHRPLMTVSKLLRGISVNRFLRRLTLGDMKLDPHGVVAILTSNNCCLEILNLISVPVTNELLNSLNHGLKQNHSLVKFCLIDCYNRFLSLATLLTWHRHSGAAERMINEDYSTKIQFHCIFEAITFSNVRTLILDINPGELAYDKPEFPHALAQMLIRNTKLETFTLNYSYFSDDYLLQIARALVLNGRKNEINLSLGTGLSPSLYSKDPLLDLFQQNDSIPPRSNCFSVKIRPDQEQFIQHEVDEFKQAMQTTMLKTLLFILNNRIQRQAIHLEQTCFNTFVLTLQKTLQCRTQRQAFYLEQTCFNTFILTLLKTLQWRVNRQKIFLAMTFQ